MEHPSTTQPQPRPRLDHLGDLAATAKSIGRRVGMFAAVIWAYCIGIWSKSCDATRFVLCFMTWASPVLGEMTLWLALLFHMGARCLNAIACMFERLSNNLSGRSVRQPNIPFAFTSEVTVAVASARGTDEGGVNVADGCEVFEYQHSSQNVNESGLMVLREDRGAMMTDKRARGLQRIMMLRKSRERRGLEVYNAKDGQHED